MGDMGLSVLDFIFIFIVQMYLFGNKDRHVNKQLHGNVQDYSHWLISISSPMLGWWNT